MTVIGTAASYTAATIVIGIIVILLIIGGLAWLVQRINYQDYQIWCLKQQQRHPNKVKTFLKKKSSSKDCEPKHKCRDASSYYIGTCFPKCACCGDIFYNIQTQTTYIFNGETWTQVSLGNYAEFFASMPPANNSSLPLLAPTLETSLIFPGQQVQFPSNGATSSSILRLSSTSFQLPPAGNFLVTAAINTDWDLLASFSAFALDMVWDTASAPSVAGDAAYYAVMYGNLGFLSEGPATIYNPNGNVPALSGHLWYTNATEVTVADDLLSNLRFAMAALIPTSTVIPPALDGQVLTPGEYKIVAGPATLTTTMTFDGDGYYYIDVDAALFITGQMLLINGAKASKIYWRVTGGDISIGIDSTATPIATVAITQGYLITVENDINIGQAASHIMNGGLFADGVITIVPFPAAAPFIEVPLFFNAAAGTTGYAGNQIVLRKNGVEQPATLTGNANPTELVIQSLVTTVGSASPVTIDISVPVANSNPLQVFRYLTNIFQTSPAVTTARLTIRQIPV